MKLSHTQSSYKYKMRQISESIVLYIRKLPEEWRSDKCGVGNGSVSYFNWEE